MPKNTQASFSSDTFKPGNARILSVGKHLNKSCIYILNASYKDKVDKKFVDMGELHSYDIHFYKGKKNEALPIYAVKYLEDNSGKPVLVAIPTTIKYDTHFYSGEGEYFVFHNESSQVIDNPDEYHKNYNEQKKQYYFNEFTESQAMQEIKAHRDTLTKKQTQGNNCPILAQKITAFNSFIQAAENLEGDTLMQILTNPEDEIYKNLIKPRPTRFNFFNFFSINTTARSAEETSTYKLLENLKKHPYHSYLSKIYGGTQASNNQLAI